MTRAQPAGGTPPLQGLTVVSVEQAVAAPFATRQLADLGARVIKVERPGPGDFARDYDETVRGMSSHFVWLNRSKESVALDLKSAPGQEAIRRLVDRADVFVHNLAPGAAERLGLGAAPLRAADPRLIYVSISGYGPGGPYTAKKAYDLLVQCEAGLVSVTGTPDQPVKVGIPVADIAAGMYAYSGILTALLRRERTGAGATLELSMLEALAEWMSFPLNYASYGGTPPERAGASHAAIAPYGPFRCRGGQLVFLGIQNEREWATFCHQVLGDAALARDPRFERNSARVENRDALTATIEAAFGARRAPDVVDQLEDVGIANALLRDMAGVAAHPQLAARQRWAQYGSSVGTLAALIPPATLAGDRPVLDPVPAPGQHTAAVLAELGLAPADPAPAPTPRHEQDREP